MKDGFKNGAKNVQAPIILRPNGPPAAPHQGWRPAVGQLSAGAAPPVVWGAAPNKTAQARTSLGCRGELTLALQVAK